MIVTLWQDGRMDRARRIERAVTILRERGALFAYLFGSAATGEAAVESDLDIAAFFGQPKDPVKEAALLPARVDLLVLDSAPLELAGRVAMHGRLLYEADPALRVEWEATIRKIWLDERPRTDRARKDFFEGAEARGRR